MEAEFLIPIAFFAALAAIIILPSYFKSKERQHMHETVRTAIEKGQELPPEVIQAVSQGGKFMSTRTQDFRKAAIWLAIAGALATMGFIVTWYHGFDDDTVVPFAFAVIPAFVGIVYLVFGLLNKQK